MAASFRGSLVPKAWYSIYPIQLAVWGLSDCAYQAVDSEERARGTLQLHRDAMPTAHGLLSAGAVLYGVRGVCERLYHRGWESVQEVHYGYM